MAGSSTDHQDKNAMKSRVLELRGAPFVHGQRINPADYAWLPFEPAWQSLVWARERGECLRAAIELKQTATYSTDREMSARLQVAAYGGGSLEAAQKLRDMEEKSHVFRVEFAPFAKAEDKGAGTS
jgi:hypothetical protein